MAPTSTKNFSGLPAAKFGKSDKRSTMKHHRANQGKSGDDAKWVRPLGALCSLRFKKRYAADLWPEIQFFDQEEKNKWIEKFVEKKMAVIRQRVAEAEVAIERERERAEDMEMRRLAAGLTKMSFQ
jgi:hypothetical protein